MGVYELQHSAAINYSDGFPDPLLVQPSLSADRSDCGRIVELVNCHFNSKVLDEAALRGADVMARIRESNASMVERLRRDGRGDLADRLMAEYGSEAPATADGAVPGENGPPLF